ncbi:hypothetical protein WB403_49120, partial [Streptomyces brasiliscabiei]
MKIEQVARGQRNVTYRLSGWVEKKPFTLDTKHKQLKLASAAWLIEEKMGIRLYWQEGEKEHLLPMESRNVIRWDTSIVCPSDWTGILWLEPFKY